MRKKLASWVAKMLSYKDRLVLINSVLTSLPIFLLSFFEIPKGVRKRLDYYRSLFFSKVISSSKNIDYLNGILCVDRKTKGGLVLRFL